MTPRDTEDININANPQGTLEIAEYFFRRKMLQKESREGEIIPGEPDRGMDEE